VECYAISTPDFQVEFFREALTIETAEAVSCEYLSKRPGRGLIGSGSLIQNKVYNLDSDGGSDRSAHAIITELL